MCLSITSANVVDFLSGNIDNLKFLGLSLSIIPNSHTVPGVSSSMALGVLILPVREMKVSSTSTTEPLLPNFSSVFNIISKIDVNFFFISIYVFSSQLSKSVKKLLLTPPKKQKIENSKVSSFNFVDLKTEQEIKFFDDLQLFFVHLYMYTDSHVFL
ncbi:hypothetical protein DMUE_0804 [Dictyocoela muelleri]|nr:hypothetical protein DMUE_0804 [Dictyocoela muelleri]